MRPRSTLQYVAAVRGDADPRMPDTAGGANGARLTSIAGGGDLIAVTEVADAEHCRDRLQSGNGNLTMPLPAEIGARAGSNLRRCLIIEAGLQANSSTR